MTDSIEYLVQSDIFIINDISTRHNSPNILWNPSYSFTIWPNLRYLRIQDLPIYNLICQHSFRSHLRFCSERVPKIFFCFFFSWSVKKYNKWKTAYFVYFKHILLFNNKQLDATQVSQIRSVFSNTSINTKFIYISTTLCFLYYCFVFISVVFYQLNNYVSENVERDLFLLHYSRIHCMSFFVSTWRVRINLCRIQLFIIKQ
jgi:hypothetical protein